MLTTPANQQLAAQDRVRIPDGRVGDVIGFYVRENESVLVRLPSGELEEFPAEEVTALSR